MPELTIDPRSVRLLVVDACAERRDGLGAQIAGAGYVRVTAAADVTQCPPADVPELVLVALEGIDTDAVGLAALHTAWPAPGPAILGLTADPDPAARARAAALGLTDLALLPIEDAELHMRIDHALEAGRLRRLLAERSAALTDALRARTAELETVHESLSALAAMADYHDDDTDHHARRVGDLAATIARALELPEDSVEMLRAAAPLHDIGKIGISRRILLKPSSLSPSEWLHMQHHVDVGAKILSGSRTPILVLAAEIARTHHEHFDGSGYSAGLRGEEIPLAGRIVAVADVWDTLTHDRPYRPAWEPERALAEIQAQAGTHFDPRVLEAFCALEPLAVDPGSRAA